MASFRKVESVRIILLGESGVGKTALLNRFQTGEFRLTNETMMPATYYKNLILENEAVTLRIDDTAGSERYRSVSTSYYNKAEGVLLVYDVTYAESYYKLKSWLDELRRINDTAEVLIVGNKSEDPASKTVNISMVKNFAKEQNLEYMETSALLGKNVEEAFLHLTRKILVRKGILKAKDSKSPSDTSMIAPSSQKDEATSYRPEDFESIILTEETKGRKKKCCRS